jgi:hypothetical protein
VVISLKIKQQKKLVKEILKKRLMQDAEKIKVNLGVRKKRMNIFLANKMY